jgi:TonB-linked SusC/RagA family outer membrane protein
MHKQWAVVGLAMVLAGAAQAQSRAIKGTVSEVPSNDPVPGAVVTVVGTDRSATSGADGSFTIADAPAGAIQLGVHAAGFRDAQVALAERENEVKVGLQRELEEEIVVTGRASTTERRHLAVSVATVRSEDLTDVPAQTVDLALQGKVTGANIQRNDGAPGGGAQVRLRGVSSINGEAEPLFVVDGMIVSNVAIPSGIFAVTKSNLGGNGSIMQDSPVNRIADLNPEDIESIEVLKGAAAAAIYGSKASNGVVIITTKRGVAGAPRVDITQRFGTYAFSHGIGSRAFGSLSEALGTFCPPEKSTGLPNPACVSRTTTAYGSGTYYDHDAELAGRHALSYETVASVSGGDKDLRYFLSGSVKDDEGIINNTGYQKQSLRANLTKTFGDKLTLNFNSNLIHSDAKRGITNNDNSNTSYWIVLSGTPSFLNLNQSSGLYPPNPFVDNLNNPLQTAALSNINEGLWRFISSSDVTLKILTTEQNQLRLLLTGGIDRFQQEDNLFFPPELFWQATSATPGTSLYTTVSNFNYNLGANLVHDWRPPSKLFSANTSGGFQYESRDLNLVRLAARNLNAGQPNIDAGTQIQTSQLRERVHDRGAYLQEEVLMFERRLALTAALRGEASSANGDPNAIYFYPKASASYSFLSPFTDVDDLKLRAAYGETGNQPLYGQRFTSLNVSNNLGGSPGIVVNPVAGDPNIRPERAREIELGTDVSAFEGAARLELSVYQRTIVDLLLQRAVAPSSGFTSQFFNGGVLRNRGIEIGLTYTPQLGNELRLQSRLGFSKNVSKVTSLPVPAFVTGGFGTSLGVFRIEQGASATQIVGDVPNPDGTHSLVKIGDVEPDFLIHFSNRLQWRNFTLSFLLDWQKGSSIINLTRLLYDASSNSADWNTAGQARLTQWLKPDARVYVESGSFLKLREITLSYDVAPTVVSQLWSVAKRLRFSVSARNLLTFTPYSGFDPEVSNFANQPIYRNIDVAPYPPSRSFWTSLDVGFY